MFNKKNIVVLGGGSAGWMTALFVKKNMPDANVTLIESSSIGILGAGEGTVPYFVKFLNDIGITADLLIKRTNATIKNGIKFTNWNGSNDFYHNNFKIKNPHASIYEYNNPETFNKYPLLSNFALEYNDIKNFDLASQLSNKNRVPFFREEITKILLDSSFGAVAMHIDALALANLLKDVGVSRGIKVIDGKFADLSVDEKYNIKKIILEDGRKINSDFVFDCTGFARIIIGKFFKSKWKSYSDKLLVNSAIPFFIPMDDTLPSHSEGVAMKYGWLWKTPLQHRFGCGYTFSSEMVSYDDAVQEIENYLGFKPHYPRGDKGPFTFNAGVYEETWIGNCIAIGLSSGFIEPLEATAMMMVGLSLELAFLDPYALFTNNNFIRNRYNKRVSKLNQEVFDYVYFHYMTKRNDTDFWKFYSNDKNSPEYIQNIIESWQHSIPTIEDFEGNKLFGWLGYFVVGNGINRLNKKLIIDSYHKNGTHDKYINQFLTVQNNIKDIVNRSVSHKEAIAILKQL